MDDESRHLDKKRLSAGLQLLAHPVLPLVSMVRFLFFTGPFATVAEVIAEMPEPIETPFASYENPRKLLGRHTQALELLESVKAGGMPETHVLTIEGEPVDTMTAVSSLCLQSILTDELEEINSLLCGPCGCRLCCIGPSSSMRQDFFEIPLQDLEVALFDIKSCDTAASRSRRSMDEFALVEENVPFYKRTEPGLFHWQDGWSLILPKSSQCPHLEAENGRCLVYDDRPEVCRRPQIFPYIVEQVAGADTRKPGYRLRNAILAVIDCPYVALLQDEIAAYGAACELEVIFKQNKS
jgi:Fe-S-cluster containining protein